MTEYFFTSSNGINNVHCVAWEPEGEPKACIIILHGMTEHILRYEKFALAMNKEGFYVAGHDHLGHGKTALIDEELGYFGYKGLKYAIMDIDKHVDTIKEKFPDIPIVILGHSMGSFFTRLYLTKKSEKLNGAIIVGTGYPNLKEVKRLKLILNLMMKLRGEHFRSKMIQQLMNQEYCKRIENPKTPSDWLSRDENLVAGYANDKFCRFTFTINGYGVLLDSILLSGDKKRAKLIRKDLPMFLISGEEDPVGDYGDGVVRTAIFYKSVGMTDIKFKLYKDDRHEILNEPDQEVVFSDVADWIRKNLLNT